MNDLEHFGGYCCKKCHWRWKSSSRCKKAHGDKCQHREAPYGTPRAPDEAPWAPLNLHGSNPVLAASSRGYQAQRAQQTRRLATAARNSGDQSDRKERSRSRTRSRSHRHNGEVCPPCRTPRRARRSPSGSPPPHKAQHHVSRYAAYRRSAEEPLELGEDWCSSGEERDGRARAAVRAHDNRQ